MKNIVYSLILFSVIALAIPSFSNDNGKKVNTNKIKTLHSSNIKVGQENQVQGVVNDFKLDRKHLQAQSVPLSASSAKNVKLINSKDIVESLNSPNSEPMIYIMPQEVYDSINNFSKTISTDKEISK
jgi:hypothetical protein